MGPGNFSFLMDRNDGNLWRVVSSITRGRHSSYAVTLFWHLLLVLRFAFRARVRGDSLGNCVLFHWLSNRAKGVWSIWKAVKTCSHINNVLISNHLAHDRCRWPDNQDPLSHFWCTSFWKSAPTTDC